MFCIGILSVALAVTRAGVGQGETGRGASSGLIAASLFAHPACFLGILAGLLALAGIRSGKPFAWGWGARIRHWQSQELPGPKDTLARLNRATGPRLWRSAAVLVLESPGLCGGAAFEQLLEELRPFLAPDELLGQVSRGRLVALLEPAPSCLRCFMELTRHEVFERCGLPLLVRALARPHGGWRPGEFTDEAALLLKAELHPPHSDCCPERRTAADSNPWSGGSSGKEIP